MKKIRADYVAFNYNSAIGYSLLIQEISPTTRALRNNIRATFSNAEDVLEYLECKAGKVMARGFSPYFEEVRKLIVNEPDIRREIISDFYIFSNGKLSVKKNK